METLMHEPSIDVFCHCLPPAYCEAVDRVAVRTPWMFARARTIAAMVDLEARLRVMDAFAGYQQVLSLASPAPEAVAEPDAAVSLAKIANDAMAQMVEDHCDRFPGFVATLPLNHPDAALAEAERAVQQLGALGVQIYTNVNGRPLDEPKYLALFEQMARLERPVWLHPIRPMTHADYRSEKVSKFDLWWALGWPYETSTAMARLVFAGVFDRWPQLSIITHHCGGITPMMEGRFGLGLGQLGARNPPELADAVQTNLQEPPLRAMRRFYADTASFGSRPAIQCAQAFFGSDRLLFATDMPFDPEGGPAYIRETLRALHEMEIDDKQRAAILSGNARRLLQLSD